MMFTSFIINLPSSIERRQAMMQRLQEVGLEAEFWEACDGRKVDVSTLPEGMRQGALSPGEIGCYLSHFKIWQTVVQRKLPFALILEDDVQLDHALPRVCRALQDCGLPFDMVRLSALDRNEGRPVLQLDPEHRLVLPSKSPTGTQGYLVSQAGAQRLLNALGDPTLPIDCELNLYWRHDLRVLLLDPPVVCHDEGFCSYIAPTGRVRIDTSLHPLQRFSRSLQKRAALRRIFNALKEGKAPRPAHRPSSSVRAYFQRLIHRNWR